MSLFQNNISFASTLTISNEVSGNNATGRNLAADLDDSWSSSFTSGAFNPNLFDGAVGFTGAKTFNDPNANSYNVTWQFGYIDQLGPGTPTSTTFTNATSGNLTIGASNSIQSGAPNPFSTQTRISANFGNPGLTAIKLDFTNSPTDIFDFGIFVGDLETRVNNGTDGRVIVFDLNGNPIGDHSIITNGTVLSSGGTSTYTSVEPSGTPSGNNNNNLSQWGNRTTIFLSVNAAVAIGSVIIHVGDDDHTNNNSGISEQLGVVGFQLPSEPTGVAGTPVLSANKTVALFDTSVSAYALPGEDVIYTINVENTGDGPVDTDNLFLIDNLPPEVAYFTGDIDGTGPVAGPVLFAQSANAGLSFNNATDVAYSDGPTPPSAFTDCDYTPIAIYDENINYVCFRPQGSLNFGPLNPNFQLSFRAAIQ